MTTSKSPYRVLIKNNDSETSHIVGDYQSYWDAAGIARWQIYCPLLKEGAESRVIDSNGIQVMAFRLLTGGTRYQRIDKDGSIGIYIIRELSPNLPPMINEESREVRQ